MAAAAVGVGVAQGTTGLSRDGHDAWPGVIGNPPAVASRGAYGAHRARGKCVAGILRMRNMPGLAFQDQGSFGDHGVSRRIRSGCAVLVLRSGGHGQGHIHGSAARASDAGEWDPGQDREFMAEPTFSRIERCVSREEGRY